MRDLLAEFIAECAAESVGEPAPDTAVSAKETDHGA